ncbi:MAG: CBS domain-containing protein [Desulfobacterales bacterium]|nr:CBS domain-containing protein [Desulfobacterales bacterium]
MQIITTHKSTDFDGVASIIAGTILYPGAIPVLPKIINPNVKAFLSIHKDIFEMCSSDDIDFERVDSIVIVDTNSWTRLENMNKLKKRNDIEVILWDHHDGICDINPTWKCQEPSGANITLMLRQIKSQDIALTPMQSTLFLTGVYEDTGNLTFLSTTSEDAYSAGYLLERKADLIIINTFLRPAYGEKQKNILFEMLKNVTRSKVNGFNISFSVLDIAGHINNLSIVVHMYREIVNVDAAFGIFVDDSKAKCIIIGRSNNESLNVGSIMRSMGGGGHPGAGSSLLKSVNPDAIKEWIIELIKGNQEGSVNIKDLMSYPVHTVESSIPMREVMEKLRKKGCTGFPVMEGERIIGVISRRDFTKIIKKSQKDAPVKAFMSTNIITIGSDKSPMEAARIMVKHDIGRLPVIENGKMIGIITRSDAMRYFYDVLPNR